MTRLVPVILLIVLAGCNSDGSFHVPFTIDRSMTAQEVQAERARMTVCDNMQGARPDKVAFCRQELGGPGNSSGGNTYVIGSGPGNTSLQSITVYSPN